LSSSLAERHAAMYERLIAAMRRAGLWRWLSSCALIAVTATLVTLTIRHRHLQMDRDEANHARQGQIIAVVARDLSATELFDWLQRSHEHPPGHGVLLGSWFLMWGTSVLNARLYSVLCFFLIGIVLWRWAAEQCTSNRHRLAVLPVLWLTTDVDYVTTATLSMLELPAALWTAVALWLHTRALERTDHAGRRWDTLASLAATLVFMIRYSFGIPLIAALGLSHLSRVMTSHVATDRHVRVEAGIRLAIFATCAGLVTGGWLLGLGQLAPLLDYSGAQPQTVARWSLENLLYYPKALVLGNITSCLLACTFVIGLGWSLWRRRLDAIDLVLLAYLALVFVELFFVRQKATRFGMPFGPALWMVTARMLERLVASGPPWLRNPDTSPRVLALGGAAISVSGFAFFGILAWFPNQYENVNTGIHDAYLDITQIIKPWERPATGIALFHAKDHWPGPALAFHLMAACEAHDTRCDVTVRDRDLPPEVSNRHGVTDALVDRTAAIAKADFAISYGRMPKHPGFESRSVLLRKNYQCEVIKLQPPPTASWAKVTILGPVLSPDSLAERDSSQASDTRP
jgi:hypothetical protein